MKNGPDLQVEGKPEPSVEEQVTYALKVVTLVILSLVLVMAAVTFVLRVQTAAVIIIGGIFFAYLIYPLVHFFGKRMPLGLAIMCVYLIIFALVFAFFALVVPPLGDDIRQVVRDFPKISADIRHTITDPNTPVIGKLAPNIRDYLANSSTQMATYIQNYGSEVAGKTLTILVSTASAVAIMVAIPVIAAYLILDAERLRRNSMLIVPVRWRPKAQAFIEDVDTVLGGFIRGQLIVATIIGCAIAFVLTVIPFTRIPYGLLIGLLAGVLDLIPYVGAVASFIPAVMIGGISGGFSHAIAVAIAFILVFELEGHFVSPNVVSHSVGLTPLIVIIAILIGGDLFGIAGMFVSIPVAGVIRMIVLHAVPKDQQIVEPAVAKGIILPGNPPPPPATA